MVRSTTRSVAHLELLPDRNDLETMAAAGEASFVVCHEVPARKYVTRIDLCATSMLSEMT